MEVFDLSLLPQKAQEELKDFYQFLVERYGNKDERESESRKKRIEHFFDKYNLDLSSFKFTRDEIYER